MCNYKCSGISTDANCFVAVDMYGHYLAVLCIHAAFQI
jgi:hypothetical protein